MSYFIITDRCVLALTCLLASAAALAAEPPAGGNKAPLSATAGPAVDVSADKPAAAPAPKPAAQAQPTAAEETSGTAKTQASGQASTQTSTQAPRAPAKTAKASGPKSNDRLALDTTVVTGNRELPKVLYIVPWKKADIGELPAQPFNTLLDEVLTPVDRDVFRREVTYYGAISNGPAAAPNGSSVPGSQPPGTEK